MDPLDCPFRTTADLLARYRLGASVQAIVADIHAEATSEKMAYAHVFDGQMSFVVGTHTHCPRPTRRCFRAERRSSRMRACAAITTA